MILVCKGKSNKEIGEQLSISDSTVASHRKHIFKKTDCHSSIEILNYCIKNGLYMPVEKDNSKMFFSKFLKVLLPK